MLSTTLLALEQQLSRVTETVQLYLQHTEDATESDILTLVARVERASGGLQTATEQLLTLARSSMERRPPPSHNCGYVLGLWYSSVEFDNCHLLRR
jgi:hypothetical protein